MEMDCIYFLDTHSRSLIYECYVQDFTDAHTGNKLSVNSNENGWEFWSRFLVMAPLMI